MKRLFLLSSLLLAATVSVWGQKIEKIYTRGGETYEGYICEQVPGEYICVKTENTTRRLGWNTVEKTEKLDRDSDFTRGVLDVMVLKTGRFYKGRIVETVLGKSYRLELPDSSDVVVKYDNVFSISSEPADMKAGLWSQVDMLDRIDVRNGDIIEGFIVARLIGQSLTIRARNSSVERTIPTGEIIKYVKIPNPDYVVPAPPVKKEPEKVEPPTFAQKLEKVKIDGAAFRPATLTREADGKLVLKNRNVVKAKGRGVRLIVPVDSAATVCPKVIKLREERIYHRDRSRYPYYQVGDGYKPCSYVTVVVGRDSTELSVTNLEPGFYMVLPYLEGEEAAIFEVVK